MDRLRLTLTFKKTETNLVSDSSSRCKISQTSLIKEANELCAGRIGMVPDGCILVRVGLGGF